jgi:hypothetical protein
MIPINYMSSNISEYPYISVNSLATASDYVNVPMGLKIGIPSKGRSTSLNKKKQTEVFYR